MQNEYDPDLIVTHANKHFVQRQLINRGKNPVQVAIMSTSELANAYHETGAEVQSDGDLQRITSEIFVKILETVNAKGFSVDMTRIIATQELRDEIATGTAARDLVVKLLEELAPRRVEIASPQQTIRLDGPLHYITETVIRIAAMNHPIMLVGPAGCGKTTIGEHVAQALNFPFFITSTINDTHELTGFIDGHGNYHTTPFRQAYEFGGVWVADEIDAWDAAALLSANSALANGYATFPDRKEPILRSSNFRMVATANTFGNGADRVYIGRNELDAATLDRFATIDVDYDLNLERIFGRGNQRWLDHVWRIRKIVNEKKIRHVVSSRAIIMGAAALKAGLSWEQVEEIYLLKGMSESDRGKLD